MRHSIRTVAAALLIAGVAACTSGTAASTRQRRQPVPDTSSGDRATTPVDRPTTAAPRRTNLRSMLLRVDEVGSGYDPAPSAGTTRDLFCDAAKGRLPGATASAEVSYQRGPFGPFITNEVATYRDVGGVFDALRMSTALCRHFVDHRADGVTTRGSFGTISFPRFGDRTFAARFTGTSDGVPLSGTVIVVARGNLATMFTAVGEPHAAARAAEGLEAYVGAVTARLVS